MQAYRKEIDGLRAIAVLAVIFFHAEFSLNGLHLFQGGFLGVDVFFVISGYLTGGILLSEIASGKFSLLQFYERRARRILPALFFIILACIPFAWSFMTPPQLSSFSTSVLATISFASNFFFWHDTSYFSQAIQLKPLLHTWSLGVEEQFYILFPLILLVLARKRAPILAWIMILLIMSLLLSEIMGKYFSIANFYLFPTRAWELLAGVLLAKLEKDKGGAWRIITFKQTYSPHCISLHILFDRSF